MSERPVTYIAGPYSANPTHCTTAAIHFATALYLQTVHVPLVPHLSHYWDGVWPQPYEFWLTLDLHLLKVCDSIIRLPGASSGADAEMVRARELGITEVPFLDVPGSVRNEYFKHLPQEVKLS